MAVSWRLLCSMSSEQTASLANRKERDIMQKYFSWFILILICGALCLASGEDPLPVEEEPPEEEVGGWVYGKIEYRHDLRSPQEYFMLLRAHPGQPVPLHYGWLCNNRCLRRCPSTGHIDAAWTSAVSRPAPSARLACPRTDALGRCDGVSLEYHCPDENL